MEVETLISHAEPIVYHGGLAILTVVTIARIIAIDAIRAVFEVRGLRSENTKKPKR